MFLPTHRSRRILFSPFYRESLRLGSTEYATQSDAGWKWRTRDPHAQHVAGPHRPSSFRSLAFPQGFRMFQSPAPGSRARAPQIPMQKHYLQTAAGRARTLAFASPRTERWIPAAGRRRGRGGGGGCRQARAAGRRQARGDERRAPGEGAAPGDRLQPRRAPRPRPAPPSLPGAEAAARAGAALIALGPGTQPARSRDNLAPQGMTIRPNGTTSLPEE